MPRTIDQVVQETLGALVLETCRLRAELEAAQAQIAELTAKQAKSKDGA